LCDVVQTLIYKTQSLFQNMWLCWDISGAYFESGNGF